MTLERFVLALKAMTTSDSSSEEVIDLMEDGLWRLQVDSRGFVEQALGDLEQLINMSDTEQDLRSLIEPFFISYGHTTTFRPEAPAEALLWDLQEKAAALEDPAWHSPLLIRFVGTIEALLDEALTEEEYLAELEAMDTLIAQADSSYEETSVLPKEVTVESTATDLLLGQGVTEWRDTIRDAAEGLTREEFDWDHCLLRAERANRLLMALQLYNVELQQKVRDSKRP